MIFYLQKSFYQFKSRSIDLDNIKANISHLSSKELFDAIHAKYLEPDEFVIQGWMDEMNGLKWKHCKSALHL